jgi:hypothetical protein
MQRDGGKYLPVRPAFLPAVRYDVIHLTQRPGDSAKSSDNRVGSRMGVLSTILKAVKLEGAMFYKCFRIHLLVNCLHLILRKALAQDSEHNGTDGTNLQCNMLLHIAL